MPDAHATSPLLLPRPRRITALGGPPLLRSDDRTRYASVNSAISLAYPGPEAYRLTVRPDGRPSSVLIEARTHHGERLAHHTLAQLRRQFPEAIPALVIEDWPAFPTRGVMLDISRDRVPTMSHLLETVDLLASFKFNHLQLYTEHTFAYAGHEEVWQGCSPMTADEIRTLDAHCQSRGVELAANQNCFGHLARWLRLSRYAPLAETHGDWFFETDDGRKIPRSGPFSLCPTDPGSLDLVRDLLSQLLPNFSSPLVNVGADETHDVGQGRSREDVSRRGGGAIGRTSLYTDFVNSIAKLTRTHNKRPMFWADIALSHPESLRNLDPGFIGLAWGYEPDARFGRWCEALRAASLEAWVCPGTSSWRSITGRTTERRANLLAAAAQGESAGATGFLVCDWGDLGHRQQWPISLHALAEAADAAWRGEAAPTYDPRAASLHSFHDDSLATGPWLNALGNADLPLRETTGPSDKEGRPGRVRNSSALFNDLQSSWNDPARPGDPDAWLAARTHLESLRANMPRGLSPAALDELTHTLDVATLAADRAMARRARTTPTDHDRRDFSDRLRAIISDHQRLWLSRSRPGGLESSTSHYSRTLRELTP